MVSLLKDKNIDQVGSGPNRSIFMQDSVDRVGDSTKTIAMMDRSRMPRRESQTMLFVVIGYR